MFIIIYGVSGSGKSTVANLLSNHYKGAFIEADNYHSISNIQKLKSGIPLTDIDRFPWIESVCSAALKSTNHPVFIACSALKQAYRLRFIQNLGNVKFILLNGTIDVVRIRLSNRSNHFMNPNLLTSQIETLEIHLKDDDQYKQIDISNTIENIINQSITWINSIVQASSNQQ